MLEITYDMDRTNAGEVLGVVQGLGFAIVDVTTREADLEDVFVTLTSNGSTSGNPYIEPKRVCGSGNNG